MGSSGCPLTYDAPVPVQIKKEILRGALSLAHIDLSSFPIGLGMSECVNLVFLHFSLFLALSPVLYISIFICVSFLIKKTL